MVFASDDPLAVQGFVAAGLGAALAPGLAMASVRDDVVVREVAVGGRALTRTVGVLHRAGPAARRLGGAAR